MCVVKTAGEAGGFGGTGSEFRGRKLSVGLWVLICFAVRNTRRR